MVVPGSDRHGGRCTVEHLLCGTGSAWLALAQQAPVGQAGVDTEYDNANVNYNDYVEDARSYIDNGNSNGNDAVPGRVPKGHGAMHLIFILPNVLPAIMDARCQGRQLRVLGQQ